MHQEGRPHLKSSDGTLISLPHDADDKQNVELGIRSEFINADDGGELEGTVTMNEYQGSFRTIHMDTGFGNVIMRTEAGSDLQRLLEPVRAYSGRARVRVDVDPRDIGAYLD